MKKALYYFSLLFLGYFLIGGLFFLGGKGINAKGVITVLVKPLEFILKTIKSIENDIPLIEQINNGHLYESSFKTFNQLEEDIFLLNTIKNQENESFVEIRNLKNDKILKSIKLPNVFTEGNGRRQRYYATYNPEYKKIIVITESGNQIICLDFQSKQTDWHLKSDTILFHHRVSSENNSILVNIRKLDTVNNEYIENEGFAEINILNGKIQSTWWIHDHIEELGPIKELQYRPQWSYNNENNLDLWHINDVLKLNLKKSNNYILRGGDILLSVRNINSILLVRNKKIVKVIQGEFYQQHDVDVVNDHLISIFNNNYQDDHYPWKQKPRTQIVYKDLITGKDSTAYMNLNLSTNTEGQFEKVGNFKYFENQNEHEIILLKNEVLVYRSQIKCSFDTSKINLLNWCQLILPNDLIIK